MNLTTNTSYTGFITDMGFDEKNNIRGQVQITVPPQNLGESASTARRYFNIFTVSTDKQTGRKTISNALEGIAAVCGLGETWDSFVRGEADSGKLINDLYDAFEAGAYKDKEISAKTGKATDKNGSAYINYINPLGRAGKPAGSKSDKNAILASLSGMAAAPKQDGAIKPAVSVQQSRQSAAYNPPADDVGDAPKDIPF